MASTFRPTGSYSNLTRLELERLRRADAYTSGKVLTIGDSGEGSEDIVGPGRDVSVEPLDAWSPFMLEAVNPITPPAEPGKQLGSTANVYGVPSETVSWYGPTLVYDAYNTGYAQAPDTWKDDTPGLNYALFVQPGDLLLIKATSSTSGDNRWGVATIFSVTANTLVCNKILRPYGVSLTQFDVDAETYSYMVVRPNAIKLFAAPWSGTTGREQTFLMVNPGAAVNTQTAPLLSSIVADMVTNIVGPGFTETALDRADAVYNAWTSLNELGYRVVFYPDDGTGTGPDLTKPILATHPVIDPAIPSESQGISIDYRMGSVRLSCAPDVGGDIKPTAGCVDAVTGRLNLYAVFWAVDTSLTKQTAAGMHVVRGDEYESRPAAKIWFDSASPADQQAWWVTSSSTQRGFFVYDPEGEPARFGVDTKVVPGEYRYLTYDNDRDEWRMKMREAPHDSDRDEPFEPTLADRTAMTISDSSYEPNHPGALTPETVLVSGKQGLRSSVYDIEGQLYRASLDGYSTVHLRKGTHRLELPLHVPPGVTLEGDGPQTRLEVMSGNQPAVKFGPNTPWGVYDFGYNPPYSGSYRYASLLTGIKHRRVEGQDVCWNPNKKVWAIVTADVATQSVWFNEMRSDGTLVFAGDGIEIKQNARPIMTVDTTSTAASQRYHTPGHSPRIAFHPVYNRYGAAWGVQDGITLNNAALQVVLWEVNTSDNVTILRDHIVETSGEDYTNPSVAFEEGSDTNYDLCVSYAHYSGSTELELLFINESTDSVQSLSCGSNVVISSTDLVFEDGSVVVVWSQRAHPLFGSSTASGVITSDTPRRFTSGDLPNPLAAGVISGSKLHHLNTTTGSVQGGRDYVVTNSTATYIEIQDERESTELATPEGSIFWAVSPPSKILSQRYYIGIGWGSGGPYSIVDGYPSAGNFKAEMREPDFVRVSPASGSYLVVFQTFNTTAFLARSTLPNFDNNVNTNFYDGNPVCKSQHAYREYTSTCAVLVSGNFLNPDFEGAQESLATYDVTMEQTLPQSRSLGASEPLVSFANALHLNVTFTGGAEVAYGPNRGPHLEISARHITHKWAYDRPMSLIPDVTWTGQDWAVVSPTKAMMESDTGTIRIIGGQHYLVDPTFCFGVNANNGIDNNWLPMTFSGWVELPDAAPSTTEYTGTVISEHCILLGATTPFSDGDKVRWRHIDNQTSLTDDDCRDYGNKILGFRVGSDGKVIQGSSYLLNYMSPQWSPDLDFQLYGGRMETVSRREVYTNIAPAPSTGGANAPMCYGALGPGYDPADPAPSPTGSVRGGWGNDYPTSRLSGDIGFHGICAGAPMPPGALSPYECPMVAIAWGETFYALAARQTSGKDSIWENKTVLLRQNFGPYNAEVRNLHIEGRNLRSNSFLDLIGIIQAKSRRHVFTRWGLPNAPSGAFATDGYRNCFVYSSQNGQVLDADLGSFGARTEWEDYTDGNIVSTVHLVATYTDAVGEQPITFRGPGMLYKALFDGTLGLMGMPGSDCQHRDDLTFNPVTGHSPAPVVLWTGSEFAAFWTEEDKAPYTNGTAGAYICMAMFPGSNATYIHNSALGNPRSTKNLPEPSAVVKVSCGIGVNAASALGIGGDVFGNQITVCDAAFNGRVFAVVWATGLYTFGNPPYTDAGYLEAGSVLGVTIFTNTAPNGGGTSYLVTAENLLGGVRIRQPKIVWDGTNFVLFWSVGTKGQTLSVPETGLGSPTQVKRLASSQMMMQAGVSENQTIGTLDADGNLTTGRVGSDQGLACQPGDIVMIDKTQRVAQLFPERSDGDCSNYTLTSLTGLFTAISGATRVTEAGGPYGVDNSSNNEFVDFSQNFSTAGVLVGNTLVITAPSTIAGRYTIMVVAGSGTARLNVKEPFPLPPGAVTGVTYYIDQGVQPGDHVIIVTPSTNYGRYIVDRVTSDTTLLVTTPFPNITTGENFYIERRFDSFEHAGPHVVRGYDPLTGTVGLELRSSTWQEDDEVIGSILSGGLGAEDNLARYGNMRSPYLPAAAVSYDPVQVDSADPGGNYVERMQAVVYMDTEGCFAAAYIRSNASVDVMLLSRTTMQPFQRFHYITTARSVDLAWNGKNLMLVFAERNGKIRVTLLSPQLVRIEGATLENNIGSMPSSLGQGVGQVPGPLYDALVVSNDWADADAKKRGYLRPRPKKVHVKWNDRLGRWVVSASFVWAMEGTCSGVDQLPYANNPPMWPLQYDNTNAPAFGNFEQPASSAIGGTYVGRVITGRFYVPLIQPGMRIFMTDNGFPFVRFTVMGLGPRVVDPNPDLPTPTDIYTSITVDVDSTELTAAQVALVTDAGDSQRMWAEPREDVVCWTIQQGEPAVRVSDADGVALRDVTVGGSVVDISEYYALAQPLWQSVGEFVGGVAVGGMAQRGRVIKRPYTQSFLSPEARVETLRRDNCRSRTPVKYGRHGPPGLPILGVGKPEGRRS